MAAAGEGERVGGPLRKQFAALAGEPLLLRTIRAVAGAPSVEGIAVALPRGEVGRWRGRLREAAGGKPLRAVAGGATRQESVARALAALPRRAGWVIVHDGVRPFASPALFERCLEAARRTGASLAALPVSDTLKREARGGGREIRASSAGRRVRGTLSREGLWRAQTPQAFRRELLEEAFERARKEGFLGTDEASLVERLGAPVELVEGEASNLKVTATDDLALAEALAAGGAGAAGAGGRVGVGVDFHRLVPGRRLVLGGVEIPHERGLLGHSDGDVLTHAICDALLGAAGLGDIGVHFPDTDPAYRGISSLRLLERVGNLLKEKGLYVRNVDATLIAEKPRTGGHHASMRRALASALGVEEGRVNIKATTAEGLGALGRGEGMAAHATCALGETPGRGR